MCQSNYSPQVAARKEAAAAIARSALAVESRKVSRVKESITSVCAFGSRELVLGEAQRD